ncbi:MAG: hypothetical protein ACR2PM_20895 [Hyphomicrobiales bacterium]
MSGVEFSHVNVDAIRAAAQKQAPRAFLLGIDRSMFGKPVVTVHTVRDREERVSGAALRREFRHSDLPQGCRVRRHKSRRLERANSLEAFLRGFRHQEIISDPTGCFGRALSLVDFADDLRARSDKRIAGLYWHSDLRTVYVVYDHKDFITDRKVKVRELGAAENMVREALVRACGTQAAEYVPSVRLGFELPDAPLVPIDEASYFARHTIMRWLRRNSAVPALGAVLGLGVTGAAMAADFDSPPPAGSEPAVSEPNGKISVQGGFRDEDNIDSEAIGKANGSFSLPLGHSFGAQADGWIGVGDERTFGGVGGHLFWRDPSIGLLGVTGSYGFVDYDNNPDEELGRIGGEGELYLDQLTFAAAAGYQFGDSDVDEGGYVSGEVRWYLSPDFLLYGGAEYDPEREGIGRAGVEFQPGLAGFPGLSLFADGMAGDNDFAQVLFGVRYYFGSPKSLVDRHRKDDPKSLDTSDNHVPDEEYNGFVVPD